MLPPTVRPYASGDEPALLALWNAALPYDPVDARVFRRKVILDPNFASGHLLVAEGDGGLAGFCLCVMRRVPLEKVGLEGDRGWITAFGVHPDCRRSGVGSALLEAAVALLRGAGRTQVSIAPYAPNYFVPGVDVDHYADGLAFLRKRGFEQVAEAISMDANIVLLDTSRVLAREADLATQDITIRALRSDEAALLMAFLQAHMPGDWVRHARELLVDCARGLATEDQIIVALSGAQVVGYCQYEGEHFGPFGVREDMQGKGVGTVLLARCLETMRRAGHHNAWVLWTSQDTADKIYAKLGFRVTRRFAILCRML